MKDLKFETSNLQSCFFILSILSILVNYSSNKTSGQGQSLCPYRHHAASGLATDSKVVERESR